VADECLACETITGRIRVPGGDIHRGEFWLVDHCLGPLGIGSLVVKPLRHVTRVSELTASEASELGPVLTRTAAVVDELMRPEQVYAWLFSHAEGVPVHVHFVVQPATRQDMDELADFGPHLTVAMFERGALPDADAMVDFATRAQSAF
jgi:diadenosine tetraphosphate (Ap4A) HIT family hydrolase